MRMIYPINSLIESVHRLVDLFVYFPRLLSTYIRYIIMIFWSQWMRMIYLIYSLITRLVGLVDLFVHFQRFLRSSKLIQPFFKWIWSLIDTYMCLSRFIYKHLLLWMNNVDLSHFVYLSEDLMVLFLYSLPFDSYIYLSWLSYKHLLIWVNADDLSH